jgi:hypothetical protein
MIIAQIPTVAETQRRHDHIIYRARCSPAEVQSKDEEVLVDPIRVPLSCTLP